MCVELSISNVKEWKPQIISYYLGVLLFGSCWSNCTLKAETWKYNAKCEPAASYVNGNIQYTPFFPLLIFICLDLKCMGSQRELRNFHFTEEKAANLLRMKWWNTLSQLYTAKIIFLVKTRGMVRKPQAKLDNKIKICRDTQLCTVRVWKGTGFDTV